jgi:predicted nucleotidyltransferase
MKHEERIQIAKYATEKMIKKYGKDILVGGIFGSTARNEDEKYSDLEMVFIVKDSSKARTVEFYYKDILISLDVLEISEVKKSIKNVDIMWPLRMARLFSLQITCGDKKILHNFHNMVKKIPKRKFKNTIQENVYHIKDGLNKIKTNKSLRDKRQAIAVAKEILYGINLSVALLNKKYFTRNFYYNFPEAYKFKKLPKDYKKLVEEIWLCTDVNKLFILNTKLINNFLELLEKNRIKPKSYDSLEKIKF